MGKRLSIHLKRWYGLRLTFGIKAFLLNLNLYINLGSSLSEIAIRTEQVLCFFAVQYCFFFFLQSIHFEEVYWCSFPVKNKSQYSIDIFISIIIVFLFSNSYPPFFFYCCVARPDFGDPIIMRRGASVEHVVCLCITCKFIYALRCGQPVEKHTQCTFNQNIFIVIHFRKLHRRWWSVVHYVKIYLNMCIYIWYAV